MTSKRELDIVEELRFFAEAAETKGIVLTMLSGATFTESANEIERLRSLITEWADADDSDFDPLVFDDCECDQRFCIAVRALREAVGR
jgi:hypothetical protein